MNQADQAKIATAKAGIEVANRKAQQATATARDKENKEREKKTKEWNKQQQSKPLALNDDEIHIAPATPEPPLETEGAMQPIPSLSSTDLATFRRIIRKMLGLPPFPH